MSFRRTFEETLLTILTTRDLVARRLSGIEGLRVPRVLRLHNPGPGAAPLAVQRVGGEIRYLEGAAEFLATVTGREGEVMRRLFAGAARPFDLGRVPQPV